MKAPASRIRLLKPKTVAEITGLSRSTICRLEQKGQFPKRVWLTSYRTGFVESEVLQWVSDKIENRDAAKYVFVD